MPIRGHRRIDAAREQARHAAAGAGRQAAGARLLAEEIERVVRHHLDVNRQRRLVEIDVPTLRLLDEPAHFALDLRRRERQPLVGSRRRHAERLGLPVAQVGQDGGPRAAENRAARGPRRKSSRCRTRAGSDPSPRPTRPACSRGRARSRCAPSPTAPTPRAARQRGLQIAHEQLNEPRTVLPLQRELFVVNNDRGHELGNRVIGYLGH